MSKHITITGELGSGKSTVAKLLAEQLDYSFFSTGDAHRMLAQQMGITTLQLNQKALTDRTIDDKIDDQIKKLAEEKTPFVIDSRLAFHFIPSSFKVMLTVAPEVGAQRIMQARRSSESAYTSLQNCLKANTIRRKMEQERFIKLYQVDICDKKNFDLVIDTTHQTPEEIAENIIFQYKKLIPKHK